MEAMFSKAMELANTLSEKQRDKEESVTYQELLRYIASIARFNTKLLNDEIRRCEDAQFNSE